MTFTLMNLFRWKWDGRQHKEIDELRHRRWWIERGSYLDPKSNNTGTTVWVGWLWSFLRSLYNWNQSTSLFDWSRIRPTNETKREKEILTVRFSKCVIRDFPLISIVSLPQRPIPRNAPPRSRNITNREINPSIHQSINPSTPLTRLDKQTYKHKRPSSSLRDPNLRRLHRELRLVAAKHRSCRCRCPRLPSSQHKRQHPSKLLPLH